MAKAVWMFSFKLKKDVSEEEFIAATKKLHDEVVSKQKGFISWRQLLDEDVWIDLVTWETMEDAKKAMTAGSNNSTAKAFYSLLNMSSCKTKVLPVAAEY
ncbi:hypothetical protein [uncultured Enterococcus sp.]|uniref:antibiotic biosynthesis monooxygenase family protein n=1 Tax=uncultured Enterococcus sp. TaxID=167972 RepID=UPI002AA87D83|nr:hypothetical protein [uncultured Enterococcus sp.]